MMENIVQWFLTNWIGIILLALGLWVVSWLWKRAETYAAGRGAGVVHLLLTIVFSVIMALLLFVALWVAKVLPINLVKVANNTILDNQAQWEQLPPLGTVMPVWGNDATPGPTEPAGNEDWKNGFIYEVSHSSGCATERSGPQASDPEIACIPNGVDVCVLEFVSSNTVDGRSLRGHVRAGGDGPVVEGWVHSSALSLPAIKPCP